MSFDESRLRELQSALRQKMANNKEIADSFRIEGGTVMVSTEQKSAFDKNMADIKEIKSLIDGMENMRSIENWGAESPVESLAAAVAAGESLGRYSSVKSLGSLFLDSAEFKALDGGRNGANMPSPFTLTKGDVTGMWNQKDVFSAMPSGNPGSFGTIERDPIVVPPMRTRRVRDLFPVRTTTAAVIEYFQMTGFTTPGTTAVNAASSVAERNPGNTAFQNKPQSSFTFTGQQAPIRTLAHWEAAHRNVLADEPQLRSIIDNELLYGLRLQEDTQILNGNGTGENLTGILSTSGIQTYDWSAGATLPVPDTKADAIRRAATLSFLAYYEPTGVVVHPNDWEDIELTKNDQGTYLMAVSMQMGSEARIWRMPIVDTPAITEGTALVGAFGTGAQLYDREQASIRISEQHSDFFVRNAIVILAEQRLALAVKRPESFVEITFDSAPS
jgi:HK97 family phage major capsid protein